MSRAISSALCAVLLLACGGTGRTEPPEPSQVTAPSASAAPRAPDDVACRYDDFPGTATITALAPVAGWCDDAVSVQYDFTPTDPDAPSRYRFRRFSDRDDTWEGAMGPAFSRSCLAGLGVSVGSALPAKRSEMNQGACTPWFHAIDVDASRCNHPCG